MRICRSGADRFYARDYVFEVEREQVFIRQRRLKHWSHLH